jgi:hypothetical protein
MGAGMAAPVPVPPPALPGPPGTIGSLPPGSGMDTSGPEWVSVPCDALLLLTDPIKPARPFDYFGVFGPKYVGQTVLLSDSGNACMGASDRAACVERLKQSTVDTEQCVPPGPCKAFTVFTRGDQVERPDLPALRALFGEIDSTSEAVVVAMTQGLMLTCSGPGPDIAHGRGTKVRATDAGFLVYSTWDQCGSSFGIQSIEVQRDGTTGAFENTIFGRSGCVIGRRPEGLELAQLPGDRHPLATFLANCAQLEAASVYAFQRLQRDLRRLGAADSLLAAAHHSAVDELRHAQLTAALAQRYGGAVREPQLSAPAAQRSALAIALENAVEGCVRETFGAAIAWHQAALALDPQVAHVMRGIAADETRHAELSWSIADWLEPQLSEADRSAIAAARSRALRELEHEIDAEALPEAARAQIGVPSATVQRALLQRMAAELGLS